MARDDIKIIEFGMGDDVDGNAPAQSESSIRILEFDEPAGTASPTAVSGEDVGPIKIIEFDVVRPQTGRTLTCRRLRGGPSRSSSLMMTVTSGASPASIRK